MPTNPEYDLVAIGSGGGAFAAAIAAREAGLSVLMIERGTLGGTCVNVGCIPSKTLLAAAEVRSRAGERRFAGIRTQAGPVDLSRLVADKDEMVAGLRQEKYLDVAEHHGIELVSGDARFVAGPAVQVDGRLVRARHYLIATGAAPAAPDVPGLAASGYLTSTTAMALDRLPESLLVLGGGYVAMELAQLFARLGSEVTMLVRSTLARHEEPEIAAGIRAAFESEGIRVIEGVVASGARREGDRVVVSADGRDHGADELLVATGRAPRTAGLGLEAVAVAIGEGGEVLVDDGLRTTNPRIWAAGDVTGHPQFTYVAARHGTIVVDNAFNGGDRSIDYRALPRITFTSPTIASAGLTEAEAQTQGLETDSRVVELADVPRAIVSRNTRGLVKLVAECQTGRVLGAHMLADGAGDTILAGVYAIQANLTVTDLASSWNPYLTMGEALHLAAQSFTHDVQKLSCCAI